MLHKTLRCSACLIAVLCLVSAAWAGFTLEQVMSYSFPDHLVAAAKSDRVAWVFNQRGVRNIWVADAPGFSAHAITHYTADDGQDIPALALTPHGATAVYVRGTELFEENSEVTIPTSNVHGAKRAWDSSPDAAVQHWQSPVLLIQGDDDPDVPFSQTVDLAQRLRANHVRFEQLVLPDEAHDMLLWRNWVSGYRATAEFFNRMLMP